MAGTRMLQRRGTAAEWAAANPVLGDGELGFERDTKIIKMGDGVTPWNLLTSGYIRKAGGDDASIVNLTITGDFKPQTALNKLPTDAPSTYPLGLTISLVTTANGWPVNGSLITVRTSTTYCSQTLVSRASAAGNYARGSATDVWGAWSGNIYDSAWDFSTGSDTFPIGISHLTTSVAEAGNPEAVSSFGGITIKPTSSSILQIAWKRSATTEVPLYWRQATSNAQWSPWAQFMTKSVADATYIPLAVVDAAGDLIVGTADNTVGRLAKGADGSILTVVNGALAWAPAGTAGVSKSGDTMTGTLVAPSLLAKAAAATMYTALSPDNIEIGDQRAAAGPAYVDFHSKVGNDYDVRMIVASGSNELNVLATSGLKENGSRVYSANYPPPVSGMTVLGGWYGTPTSSGPSPGGVYDGVQMYWQDLQQSFTFVAPASGKALVRLGGQLLGANYILGFRITAFHSNGPGSQDRSLWDQNGASYERVTGDFPLVGLTPGTTYTVFATMGGTSSNMGWSAGSAIQVLRASSILVEG